MQFKNNLIKFYNQILNTLFPISCLGCNKPDTWLCSDCLNKIELLEDPLVPQTDETSNLDKLIATAHYKNSLLQKIIPLYKYKFATELSQPLAELMIKTLNQFELPKQASLIPVPLYKKRFNERGFNQAELLARKIAQQFDLEVQTKTISRNKNTGHQARLSRDERLKNLDQAFVCQKPNLIQNKNIILIDDVSTTGATLNKIAGVLKRAGAKSVWGLVVAHE